MSEPANANAPDPARLDELARVTREYASYSSRKSGLACAAAGAWWLATFALVFRSETWGRIASLWGPLLVIGLLAAGRRYYQRFGTAVESERSPGSVRWRKSGTLACFLMAVVVLDTALYLEPWSGGSDLAQVALMGVLLTAPAVPLLVDRVVLGFWDDVLVVTAIGGAQMVAMLTHGGTGGWLVAKFWLGMLAAAGAFLIGVGIRQHGSYRRFARRFDALRKATA